jgi:hypothetical protein
MLQNYVALLFLFQLLIEINCRHTATVIYNKLYILSSSPEDIQKDFFYIDFSVPFITQNLLIKNLTSTNVVPEHIEATSARGSANNDTLFIIWGPHITDASNFVYTFNPQNNSFSIPKITGEPPKPLFDVDTGAINYNGMMYLLDAAKFYILDTINLTWKKGSLIGAPTNLGLGSGTLLPNNKIIYFSKQVIL